MGLETGLNQFESSWCSKSIKKQDGSFPGEGHSHPFMDSTSLDNSSVYVPFPHLVTKHL